MSQSTNRGTKMYAGSVAGQSSHRKQNASTVNNSSRVGRKNYGGPSRSNILSSSSRKPTNASGPQLHMDSRIPGRPPVQVMDESGQDVTPQPLLHIDPTAVRGKQSNIMADSSGGTPTDLMSTASIFQGGGTVSTYGGGPFTRSVFSTSQSEQSVDSLTADIAEPAEGTYGVAEITHRREETKEVLTASDLEKDVFIDLSETDTIWLLDMPGTCVSIEAEEAAAVVKQNEDYEVLVKARVGNDLYAERGMNTFNDPPKVKAIQTSKIGHVDAGIWVTHWDCYDTYEALAAEEKAAKEAEEADESEEITVKSTKEGEDDEKAEENASDAGTQTAAPTNPKTSENKSSMRSSGTESRATISDTDSVFANKDDLISDTEQTSKDLQILQSASLRKDLFVMERVINLNTYQPKLACYRTLEIIEDVDKELDETAILAQQMLAEMNVGSNLERLWVYACPKTKSRNVSCMSWNKSNPDLIACGYGQFDYINQKPGLICCWSLKNIEYPERVYQCDSGVTAMDFSRRNANLLAVGLYNGTIAIYNVRNNKDESLIDSFDSHGKHTGPVWQLKWIEKERGSGEERAEVLVSVSGDGRVTQWSIRKGFESYDLMRLKRTATKFGPKGKEKKGDALISRYAGGFCFDFSAKDSNIYLAGTEEGHIHKCSCSYNEQYLDSFFGHVGPIYKIQYSPFLQDTFISCSGDWTIKLWQQNKNNPILSFHSSQEAINDICWSPRSSTIFATVSDGNVEVWDLSQNTLDPVIKHQPGLGVKMSTVTFARNSDCVLVGDSEGQITVYQLKGMTDLDNPGSALTKVINSSLATQLKN